MVERDPFFMFMSKGIEVAIRRGDGLYQLTLNEEIMEFPYEPGEAAEVLLRVRKIVQQKMEETWDAQPDDKGVCPLH
jgi:hypothetical protein